MTLIHRMICILQSEEETLPGKCEQIQNTGSQYIFTEKEDEG